MIERAVPTYRRLDAAFNNAGVNSDAAALLENSDDKFERVMNVNLRSAWNCMKGELRQMLTHGSGAIVNCSSIGGMKDSKGRSAYSASKHAVTGLTRSATLDYAATGIRINAVCPGMMKTPMAVLVTKNYDPDIMRRMVAQNRSDAPVRPKRSLLPCYGFAARPRGSWWGMPWGRWRHPRRLTSMRRSANISSDGCRGNCDSYTLPSGLGMFWPSAAARRCDRRRRGGRP
jgi:NAD(P)-dependent dehydrogenase (short-subunit alcohol dehydrogenase family)